MLERDANLLQTWKRSVDRDKFDMKPAELANISHLKLSPTCLDACCNAPFKSREFSPC